MCIVMSWLFILWSVSLSPPESSTIPYLGLRPMISQGKFTRFSASPNYLARRFDQKVKASDIHETNKGPDLSFVMSKVNEIGDMGEIKYLDMSVGGFHTRVLSRYEHRPA